MADILLKPDFKNAPVTAPYARDMILEAHRLLTPHHPYAEHMTYVEFFEMEGLALNTEESVLFYNPDLIMQIPLNNLCKILSQVLHHYGMALMEEHAPPEGAVLH